MLSRTRRLALAAIVAALLTAAWAVGIRLDRSSTPSRPSSTFVLRPQSSPDTSSTTPGAVTWRSGAYPGNGFDAIAARRFAAYRGRPLGVVTVFLDSQNWNDITYSNWAFQRYSGYRTRMAVALPLTVRGTPLSAVADGSHDSAFLSFAKILVAHGRAASDIRLGWEFNDGGRPWSAFQAGAYIAAFRHVSSLLKGVLPHATIDWNGDRGDRTGLNPFTQLYPGDAYVNIIGVDVYDHGYILANTPTSFHAWTALPFGLNSWAAFAAAHHKRLAVPEWGLNGKGADGDNPAFITGMYGWFMQHAKSLAYEAYFNEPGGHTQNSLTDPVELHASSTVYRTLWAVP